jgi:hypothetical protein
MFEAHLTVDAASDRDAFAAMCRELGVKCVLIELARGAHPAQPMTSSHHAGELAAVTAEIAALHERVAARFAVTRVKLEADITNEGIPVERAGPQGTYFEFHAKLRVPADVRPLQALCIAAGAHLSANNIERDMRFVTLRVYEAGRDRAQSEFARLIDLLVTADHVIASTKAEFTLYDSRVELDAGWLP